MSEFDEDLEDEDDDTITQGHMYEDMKAMVEFKIKVLSIEIFPEDDSL